jgi:ubiquinone/menaquinone biosynthesis C-methylase UbiE
MTDFSRIPQREQPSTYFVQDRENEEELDRLRIQDRLITAEMGGVLPEQPEMIRLQRVLDIGCGTGDWLMELAKAYPACAELVGIDISRRMIDYACAQAEAQQLSARVEFQVMDALLILAFPAGYFGLVNLRFGSSFLRTWEWPKMLSEMVRMCRRDGMVRITEPAVPTQGSSPAYLQFCAMLQCALQAAGYYFEPTPTSITDHLPRLLKQHGSRHIQIQTHASTRHFRAGTPEGQACIEDITRSLRTLHPFLVKWGCVLSDYRTLQQQTLTELQDSGFETTWHLLTAWGRP